MLIDGGIGSQVIFLFGIGGAGSREQIERETSRSTRSEPEKESVGKENWSNCSIQLMRKECQAQPMEREKS